MAATPRFKVYDAKNEYRASCKYTSDAAVLVAALGPGATIRDGHSLADTVWREGTERFSANAAGAVSCTIRDRIRLRESFFALTGPQERRTE